MSDLINRADAIDAINTLNNGLLYTHMDYVDAVRSVPSAEVGTEMSSPNLDKVSQGFSQDLVKRQDALKTIDDCHYKIMSGYEWIRKQEIKKKLNELPSTDASLMQDRCKIDASSDLISRQDAIDLVDKVDKAHIKLKGMPMLGLGTLTLRLKELPSAQRTGKWEYHSNPNIRGGMNPEDAYCSVCGFHIYTPEVDNFDDYNYCPNCGADMRGEENDF